MALFESDLKNFKKNSPRSTILNLEMHTKLADGTTINEKYQIIEVIANGGGGTVYRALQLDLNRQVALKFLHFDLALDEESLRRFEREAKLLASLGNKHLPQIYGTETYAGQVPYIVMELLEGVTLEDELKKEGRLSWKRTAHIATQMCEALELAHENGVVHRDLKPANIMLQKDGNEDSVKIIDFGLARLISGDGQKSLTATGFLLGTPTYMSPEMCGGERVDQRADIYSLACIMYECLTGLVPFSAENPISLIYKHKTERPLSITEHIQVYEAGSERELNSTEIESRNEFARRIGELILTGLEKSPDKRFSSMKNFGDAIIDLGQDNEIQFEARTSLQTNTGIKKNRNRRFLFIVVATLSILALPLLPIAKQSSLNVALKEDHDAKELMESAEQLLKEVQDNLEKAAQANASNKSIEAKRFSRKALRLMLKELTSTRNQELLFEKELQLIKEFSKFDKYLVVLRRGADDRLNPDVEGVSAAIDLARRKNRGFHNEAELQLLESTINANPRDVFQLLCCAENFAKAGDFAAAESTLDQAAKLSKDPETPRAKRVRAIIELKKGNLAGFHKMVNEERLAITTPNIRNGGWSQVGEMYVEAGELSEAKECFLRDMQKPVKDEIEHILSIRALAKIYEQEKNYSKAIEYYELARIVSKDHFYIGNEVEYSKIIARLRSLHEKQQQD